MYIIQSLRWFMLSMPVFVLFLQENGLSLAQILLLQSIFSIVIVGLEIPSGYFSDRFGRKLSIIMGVTIGMFGYVTYSFSFGFPGFLLAEILLAVGASFVSGADSALIYDSLIELDKSDQYAKIEGRKISAQSTSEGLASIIGGFLALLSLRTPFYFQTTLWLLAIPFALSLAEPIKHKAIIAKGHFRNVLKIVKFALHDHSEVKWLIIYSGTVTASGLTIAWFIQPYFQLIGLPLALFGIIWAALQFSTAGFALVAYKIESWAGRRKSLISLILLTALAYFIVATYESLWAISIFFVFYFVRGFKEPVVKDYINKLISSENRATILSIKSMIARVIFSVVGPIFGWVGDIYSLSTALFVAGITFLILGVIPLIYLKKYKVL